MFCLINEKNAGSPAFWLGVEEFMNCLNLFKPCVSLDSKSEIVADPVQHLLKANFGIKKVDQKNGIFCGGINQCDSVALPVLTSPVSRITLCAAELRAADRHMPLNS